MVFQEIADFPAFYPAYVTYVFIRETKFGFYRFPFGRFRSLDTDTYYT